MAKGELKLKMTIGQNANPNAKMTEDPENNELLRTVIKDALSGSLAPDAIEEAQEQAKTLRDDLTRSGTMEQGTFDEDGNFITLDQTNRTFFASIYNRMKAALKAWAEFSADEEVQSLLVSLSFSEDSIRPFFEQLSTEDIFFISSLLPKVKPLIPYILQEVEELKKDPETENINIGELLQNTDKESPATDNLLIKLIVKARARMEDAQAAQPITDMLTEDLPQLQGASLDKRITIVSKIADKLQGEIGTPDNPRAGDVEITNQITTFVSVMLSPESDIKIRRRNYTAFDGAVMNTIASQWNKHQKPYSTTPAIVAKGLAGRSDCTPSPQFEEEVKASMDKMRNITTEVDATEEAKRSLKLQKKPIPDNFTFHRIGHLLDADIGILTSGKQRLHVYYIKEMPILLEHARLTRQLSAVDASLLDIKEIDKQTGKLTAVSLPITSGRVCVRDYLLRRIVTLKNDRENAKENLRKHKEKRRHDKNTPIKTLDDFIKQSPVILFSTMFKEIDMQPKLPQAHKLTQDEKKQAAEQRKETGVKNIDRNQEKRYRDYAIAVLDYWKASRFIDGYHLRKGSGRGHPVDAIVIDFND